jgi:predicted nucleic acid-binding protein
LEHFVLDASVTVSWFIPDEQASITQGILRQVVEQGAVVPLLWPLKVANALTMAVRRGRISSLQRSDALRQLAALQLSSDDQTLNEAWGRTLDLADRFRLTVYDACYLELAQRRELPLATLDRDLRAAGRKLGLELLSA